MLNKSVDFTLCWNGFQYNITGAVEDFLVSEGFSTLSLVSPLFKREVSHRELRLRIGKETKIVRIPSYIPVPISYIFDPLMVFLAPKSKYVITFSPHTTLFFLLLKKFGRVKRVIQWNIDFSPRRFSNPLLNSMYNYLDKIGFMFADMQVALNSRAAAARAARYGDTCNSHIIVPVGISKFEISPIPEGNFDDKRIFFLGNLSPTVGTDIFIAAGTAI
jgi:hypothetical protein